MGSNLVPVLSGLAVLLTALAGLFGLFVTGAASRRTASAADLKLLLDERRADRAEDRAEVEQERHLRLEVEKRLTECRATLAETQQALRLSTTLEAAMRRQLLAHGLTPHEDEGPR